MDRRMPVVLLPVFTVGEQPILPSDGQGVDGPFSFAVVRIELENPGADVPPRSIVRTPHYTMSDTISARLAVPVSSEKKQSVPDGR